MVIAKNPTVQHGGAPSNLCLLYSQYTELHKINGVFKNQDCNQVIKGEISCEPWEGGGQGTNYICTLKVIYFRPLSLVQEPSSSGFLGPGITKWEPAGLLLHLGSRTLMRALTRPQALL